MTVFTAIVELSSASWRVLRRHPVLLWFPLLSLVTLIGLTALLEALVPTQREDVPWLTVGLLVFVVHVIHVFFRVGLTSEALKALRGEQPTVGNGLVVALTRSPAIVSLAAITSTFGLALTMMGRSRHGAIKLARILVGTAWSLATYLALPVLVQERRGGIASLRRSGALFRRTWGETSLSEVGVRVITQHLFVLCVVIVMVLIHLLGRSPFVVLLMVCAFAAVASVIGALEAVYRAALYVFASEGVVPAPFGSPELEEIWRVRGTEPTEPPSTTEPPAS
jgi:uncharacterized protein DUF6159